MSSVPYISGDYRTFGDVHAIVYIIFPQGVRDPCESRISTSLILCEVVLKYLEAITHLWAKAGANEALL